VKCGTKTVIRAAIEGQRAFVVRCPACDRVGKYSLDYVALPEFDIPAEAQGHDNGDGA
jgi:hypothetical protein